MTLRRIVIADDEPEVLAVLAELLESAGHKVVGKAATGDEVVELCRLLEPDILFLDVRMPGMDGLDAAKKIMANRPLPIIMCTAYCDNELVESASKAGVYAYIVKPFRRSDLLPTIDVALSRFKESKLLKGEVETLKQKLEDRKYIEQAKGIVMRTRGLLEDEAHRFLQLESQRQSRSLPELAKAIVLAEQALSPK